MLLMCKNTNRNNSRVSKNIWSNSDEYVLRKNTKT